MRKRYGRSKEIRCPFCGQQATTKNQQGLPVCRHHKSNEINITCSCGEFLDIREGKYGPFFHCFVCGLVKYDRALEMNNLPLQNVEEL